MSDLFTTPSTGAPKFPPKPMIPAKTSSTAGTPVLGGKSTFSTTSMSKEDSKMQIVGIALIVLGIILLAVGILTWK